MGLCGSSSSAVNAGPLQAVVLGGRGEGAADSSNSFKVQQLANIFPTWDADALAGVLSPTSALVAPGRAPFSSTRPVRMDASALPLVSDYSAALLAHPLETKVATAAVLALAGDAIAQRSTAAPYDRARAASFVLFDAAYRGGFQHAAFPWIIEHCRGEYLAAAAAAAGVPGLDPSLLAAVE